MIIPDGAQAEGPQASEQVQALAKWRKSLGLTQLEVAHACGIQPGKFCKAENGFVKFTDMEVVHVAEYLYKRAEALSRALPQASKELGQIREAVGA